jgi:hypothetical protein
METIRRQLLRAWRRLWLQSVLNTLGWCLLVAFTVCFVGMLLPKVWYVPYTFASWGRAWLLGTLFLGIGATLIIAWFRRPSQRLAAVELDRRFALRERCSSALDLVAEDQETPIGKALVQDAQSKLVHLDVRDQFPLRPAPQIVGMALPIAACLALFWVPDAEPAAGSLAIKNAAEPLLQVKNSTEPILKTVQKKRQEAEAAGDLESAEEFKRIEDQLRTLQNANDADKKKIIADLNAIKQELQQKRDSLGGADRMKKTMEGLKELDKGPAEKMAKALQEGDFQQAEKELEKMIDAMRSGKLDAEQSSQLQKQLDQMKKAMEDSQAERAQLKRDAERELEKAQREGDTEKIASLQKQLEKLKDGQEQSKSMEKVQAQLAKAEQAMKAGDQQAAADALQELQDELSEMAEDQANADELEEMIEQFESAKSASKCDQCQGQGCGDCQKAGQQGQGAKGQKGKGKGKGKGEEPGDGMGEGQGEGERDESESEFKNYDAQVRDEMRKGETVNGGRVGGKNRKGVSREETREAVLRSEPDPPDAIENIQLPKAQRDQLKEYFNSLRK